jgi:hypothetical protein
MNPFEMVVIIVMISVAGSLIGKYIHAKHGGGKDNKASTHSKDHGPDWSGWDWGAGGPHYTKKELKPYLEKIDALEERIRVLERIVTDKSERLSREIDELR